MRTTLLLSLLLPGCVIGADSSPRPRDLSPAWLIDRPRLLAVAAEPAEPRPGETVRFEALMMDPNQELSSILWIACPTGDDGVGFGCLGDSDDVIGFQPGLDPSYRVPDDVLDGLEEAQRAEGAYILVQVTGLPPFEGEPDPETLDFSQVEAGYKRIVASEALTPNHNPHLGGFAVDGHRIRPDAELLLDPSQPYELSVEIPESDIETYTFINADGEAEQRVEQPYVAWYATSGELLETSTLYPYLTASWNSPPAGTEGTLVAVARDRRGGMAWVEHSFRVAPE